MKLKLLTTDDEEDAAQTEESPRGHIGTYPFGVFTEENFTGKRSVWAWNGNERKDESVVAKLCRFGWQRIYVNQELEHNQMWDNRRLALENNKMEPSGLWLSSAGTSTKLDYEIVWEDLITKRIIGQGIGLIKKCNLILMLVSQSVKIYIGRFMRDCISRIVAWIGMFSIPNLLNNFCRKELRGKILENLQNIRAGCGNQDIYIPRIFGRFDGLV